MSQLINFDFQKAANNVEDVFCLWYLARKLKAVDWDFGNLQLNLCTSPESDSSWIRNTWVQSTIEAKCTREDIEDIIDGMMTKIGTVPMILRASDPTQFQVANLKTSTHSFDDHDKKQNEVLESSISSSSSSSSSSAETACAAAELSHEQPELEAVSSSGVCCLKLNGYCSNCS